jgi:hypothetical protein
MTRGADEQEFRQQRSVTMAVGRHGIKNARHLFRAIEVGPIRSCEIRNRFEVRLVSEAPRQRHGRGGNWH